MLNKHFLLSMLKIIVLLINLRDYGHFFDGLNILFDIDFVSM